jgi:mono/diheme cytochrome c family protein
MPKNLFFLAFAVAAAAGIGYANQSTARKVVIQVATTPATNGRQMYVSYCAPCHGVDGRGLGPVAATLQKQPADLALLSKNNGGKYPSRHITSVLQFGAANPSHGTAEMPVWGPVLGAIDRVTDEQNVRALRINNLSRYLETLQAR